jgi:hypothetical protein
MTESNKTFIDKFYVPFSTWIIGALLVIVGYLLLGYHNNVEKRFDRVDYRFDLLNEQIDKVINEKIEPMDNQIKVNTKRLDESSVINNLTPKVKIL